VKFLSKVVQVNENYLKLKAGYLFPEIAKRVKKYLNQIRVLKLLSLALEMLQNHYLKHV